MPFDYVPLTAAEAPSIKSGTQRYLITYEDISALLVEDLDNRGAIECIFALGVNQEQNGKSMPVMIIAAEYNPVDSVLLNDFFDGTNEAVTHSSTKKYNLDVYDRYGHSNYDALEEYDDIQAFKTKAIAIMKERCSITGDVKVFDIEDMKRQSEITELAKKVQQLGDVTKKNNKEIQELWKKIQTLDVNGKYGDKIEKLLKGLEAT